MTAAGIVVIGNTNVDLTTYVDRHPAEGETVIGSDFTVGMGGKGANQAVAAARAGGDVSFIGRIGEDSFGELVLENLGGEGLTLTHLETVPGKTGIASIYVDAGGSNRIAVYTGASGTIDPSVATAGVGAHSAPRFLISQLEISQGSVLAALQTAKGAGATTILNIAPYAPLLEGILENTDWLIANEVEIHDLVSNRGLDTPADGISASSLPSLLPVWGHALSTNLIVTLGGEGAIGWAKDSDVFHFAASPVTAVDTVGAGDCFVGYFVAMLDSGLTWQRALAAGVLAATDSVQRAGAQSSYPGHSRAQEFHTKATQIG